MLQFSNDVRVERPLQAVEDVEAFKLAMTDMVRLVALCIGMSCALGGTVMANGTSHGCEVLSMHHGTAACS